MQQDLQRVAAESPQLSGLAASTSNIKYLAVDASNPVYGSNVEVLNLGVTKAALSNAVAIQSAFRNEVPNATAAPTMIAGTRGLSLTGTVPVTLPSGAHVTVHATAYILGTSTGVFSLIYGTTDDARQDGNVRTALRTLRLLPERRDASRRASGAGLTGARPSGLARTVRSPSPSRPGGGPGRGA